MKTCEKCEGQIVTSYIWNSSSIQQMCNNVIRAMNGESQEEVDPPAGEMKACECQAVLVNK